MPFYTIHTIGDYERPVELDKQDIGKVFEKDGKHYFKFTYDFLGDFHEDDVPLYESKKDAWKVILKRIDDHISQIQAKRAEMFAMALEDGTFIKTKEEVQDWINQRMNEVK